MSRRGKLGLAGVAIAIALASGASVGAQDGAQIVKQRQEAMKGLWPNYYSVLAKAAQGDSSAVAATPEKAQQASAEVRKIASMFPAGTGRDAVPDTRAKPEVWSEEAEFKANLAKLAGETEKLSEVAKGGSADAIKAQFANVAAACGGCHEGPIKSGGKFRFEAAQ